MCIRDWYKTTKEPPLKIYIIYKYMSAKASWRWEQVEDVLFSTTVKDDIFKLSFIVRCWCELERIQLNFLLDFFIPSEEED